MLFSDVFFKTGGVLYFRNVRKTCSVKQSAAAASDCEIFISVFRVSLAIRDTENTQLKLRWYYPVYPALSIQNCGSLRLTFVWKVVLGTVSQKLMHLNLPHITLAHLPLFCSIVGTLMGWQYYVPVLK